MMLYFFLGFFVKLITSLDDTLTHIPVVASVARNWVGRLAFAFGNFLAIAVAIVCALFLSSVLKLFPYYRFISAGIIFLLAILIYLDVFVHEPRVEAEREILKHKKISALHFAGIFGIGFIASIATVVDDVVAYSPLFLADSSARLLAVVGILAATVLEIILVVYFAEKVQKIKCKEEIASIGLVVLGFLILFGVV